MKKIISRIKKLKKKMATKTIIESRITINPEFLNKNFRKAILDKLQKVTENHCSSEYGFILKVNKILKIKENFISNVDCEVIFVVVYEAETLKPEVNKVFTGKVGMVFHGGIFVKIHDKFEVLIPTSKLLEYTFDASQKMFIHKTNNNLIQEGDKIDVMITGMKYCVDKRYKCFGNLM